MNWLDIVLIVLLFIPTFMGLRKGLIKTALSFVGLIIGIVLAGRFHDSLSGIFGFTDNETLANILAFVLILAVVYTIALLLAKLLKFIAKSLLIGWVDHLEAPYSIVFRFSAAGSNPGCYRIYRKRLNIRVFIARLMLDYFPSCLGFSRRFSSH